MGKHLLLQDAKLFKSFSNPCYMLLNIKFVYLFLHMFKQFIYLRSCRKNRIPRINQAIDRYISTVRITKVLVY